MAKKIENGKGFKVLEVPRAVKMLSSGSGLTSLTLSGTC